MIPACRPLALLLAIAAGWAADPAPLDRLPRVRQRLAEQQPVTIVGLGDSITTYAGNRSRNRGYYPVPVESSYYGVIAGLLRRGVPGAQIRVVNRGVGGETADRGLARLERDVLALAPDLVFVMYGANDGRAGRDLGEFRRDIAAIAERVAASGADVVVVAPTMSLADLTWLLPCRQAVLSLAGSIPAQVLDGTLALWPVDEDVASLAEAYDYLAMLFPPDGDDIHPSVAGQFQLGRRLWEQLAAERPAPLLACTLEHDLRLPGPSPWRLTVRAAGGRPFHGAVQVLFPPAMPVRGAASREVRLPNRSLGRLRALPPQAIDLPADGTALIAWELDLPAPAAVAADPALAAWLDELAQVGVAVFSPERNEVALVRATPSPLAAAFSGPRLVAGAPGVATVTATIANRGEAPFAGTWRFLASEATALALAPGGSATAALAVHLPAGTAAGLRLRLGGWAEDAGGAPRALAAGALEAVPCVDAGERRTAIDGELGEWPAESWRSFPAGGAEASFALARDGDDLVLALRARDPVLDFQQARLWRSDGFEAFFDARPEGELGTPGPLLQFGFFPPRDDRQPLIVAAGTGCSPATAASVRSAWRRTGDGYAIEVAIPVAGIAPGGLAAGRMIGFSLACDDVAQAGQPRTQHHWAGDGLNYASPAAYGLLRWGEGPAVWRLRYGR